jgi:hypothetical protein
MDQMGQVVPVCNLGQRTHVRKKKEGLGVNNAHRNVVGQSDTHGGEGTRVIRAVFLLVILPGCVRVFLEGGIYKKLRDTRQKRELFAMDRIRRSAGHQRSVQ